MIQAAPAILHPAAPAAIVVCVILAALALFQIALAAGAPLGRFAWGGAHRVLPPRLRIGSVVSVLIYAAIAVVILDRAGAIDVLPSSVSTVATWVFLGYFVLGIAMNAISRSRPERFTMVPVTVVLAVATFFVAIA